MKRLALYVAVLALLTVGGMGCADNAFAPTAEQQQQDEIIFGSPEAAAEFIENMFGVKYVSFDPEDLGLGARWGIRIADDELRLEKASRMAQHMWNMKERYPNIRFDHIDILFITESPIGLASVPAYGDGLIIMTVMDKMDEQRAELRKAYKAINGYEWNTARYGSTVEDVLRHELAHTLTTREHMLMWRWARMKMIFGQYGDDLDTAEANYLAWVRTTISQYATTSVVEELAEAFSLFTRSDYIVGTLTPEMENVLRHMVEEIQ